MRITLWSLLVCALMMGCDTQNSATPRFEPTNQNLGMQFDDDAAAAISSGESVVDLSSNLVSTSKDGSEADLQVFFKINPSVADAISPQSFMQFDYVLPDNSSIPLIKAPIGDDLSGSVDVTVPTDEDEATILATLGGVSAALIEPHGVLTAQLPAWEQRDTTDLSKVQAVKVALVKDSYETELVDGRRIHRFAVRVTDPSAGPLDYEQREKLLKTSQDPVQYDYSISGLENDSQAHFRAIESNVVDEESSVKVSFSEHKLAVYLVLDSSSSLVQTGQVPKITDAVSRAIIALRNTADFTYLRFTNDVHKIEGMRELVFDTSNQSGTALYYALDTALHEIENFGDPEQDKVVLVFTDGKDLASRNFYGKAFQSHAEVFENVNYRVQNVAAAQQAQLNRRLQVYTVGFFDDSSGIDYTQQLAQLDKIAQSGNTERSYNHTDFDEIESAFAAVVQNIRGNYYLEYSSQQTLDDTNLQLEVNVNGLAPVILTLPTPNTSE